MTKTSANTAERPPRERGLARVIMEQIVASVGAKALADPLAEFKCNWLTPSITDNFSAVRMRCFTKKNRAVRSVKMITLRVKMNHANDYHANYYIWLMFVDVLKRLSCNKDKNGWSSNHCNREIFAEIVFSPVTTLLPLSVEETSYKNNPV